MKAIQVAEVGGSEVLRLVELTNPAPGPDQAVVQLEASGVNFIDIYHRTGLYPLPLPFVLGLEGSGVVEALGPGVEGVAVGDRVAFTGVAGAYAEKIIAPTDKLVILPDAVDTQTAAATMLQGLTAHYLAHDTFRLGPETNCLIHAGAGGVGLLFIQMAKRLGATVLTTVGTPEKAELAAAAGADHVIVYTETDFADEIRSLIGERNLDVVYDSVGVDTFDRGLQLLRSQGLMVLFGQSSGPVPPFDLGRLAREGSLFVTRPTLANYVEARESLVTRSDELFGWIASGELEVRIGATYRLSDARAAHEALQGRATTGKVLLLP